MIDDRLWETRGRSRRCHRPRRLCATLALTVCVAVSQAAATFAAEEPAGTDRANIPLDARPYRVRLSLAFGRDPSFTALFRHQTLDRIGQCVDRTFGQMWDVEVREDRRLAPASSVGMKRRPLAQGRSVFRAPARPADHPRSAIQSAEPDRKEP